MANKKDEQLPTPQRKRGRPRASEVAAQLGEASPVSTLPDGPAGLDGLTLRQRRILEMIKETVETRGYPPSIREMGDAVGLASSSSVAHQLKVLEGKGFLRRDPNRPYVVERGDLARDAHEILAAEALDVAGADVDVVALERCREVRQCQAERE